MATNQQTAETNVTALKQVKYEERLRSKSLFQRAMYRLRHDYLTLSALAVLLLLTFTSFAAPLVVQLLNVNYNNNDLYLNKLPIGSSVSESNTTVWQWIVEAGSARRAFVGHSQPITVMAFGADGEHFITAAQDQSVRLWHITSGRTKRRLLLEDDSGLYTAVAIQPGSEFFATATSEGTINTWEDDKAIPTDPDIPVVSIDAHDGAVTALHYSMDGLTLLSASEDGTAKLWNTETGTQVKSFEVGSPVIDADFSSDDSQVVTAGEDGILTIWDVSSSEASNTIDTGMSVRSVEFGPVGETVVTAGGEAAIIWEIASGEQMLSFEYRAEINSARFTPDGTQILTANEDGTALLWDVESGEIAQSFDNFEFPMNDAVISPDGSMVLTGSDGQRRNFLLGTDTAGRDHLTRLLYGGQVSLKIGFLSAIGALSIGLVIGVTAGFYGGRIDDFIMWIITTLDSIPALYLLLIVAALLSPNDTSLILVLVFLVWTGSTRIVRGETFSIRERDYVMAARALGASNLRVMFFHIAPNVISILLIVLSRLIGGLILTESTLSFLGFGVKPPIPTWGNMLSNDLNLLREAPHLVFAPGLMITVTVLCLYIIGDGLRDAFDPTQAD